MAIATQLDGIEYRSRLEARWASFFTRIGWEHTYEPFDGDGYIPDFLIHGEQPLLVEVKPATTRAEYEVAIEKATKGLAAHWTHDILIVGVTPLPKIGDSFGWGTSHAAAGLLGEHQPANNFHNTFDIARYNSRRAAEGMPPLSRSEAMARLGYRETAGWSFEVGRWITCTCCHRNAVFHEELSYTSRPCGHYDGDGHLGYLPKLDITEAWAAACNDVKWRGTPKGAA